MNVQLFHCLCYYRNTQDIAAENNYTFKQLHSLLLLLLYNLIFISCLLQINTPDLIPERHNHILITKLHLSVLFGPLSTQLPWSCYCFQSLKWHYVFVCCHFVTFIDLSGGLKNNEAVE